MAGALVASVAAAQQGAPPPALLAGPALGDALRAGGYVLFVRHASTGGGDEDHMTGYADCTTQRNLSDAGRQEARAIGAAVRGLRIPVGPVLASPYCRTMETAQLAFGAAAAAPFLRMPNPNLNEPYESYVDLYDLLAAKVAKGSNLVLVSHVHAFRAVTGFDWIDEGDTAVIEPLGNGKFRIVARITKDGWAALAPR